MDIPADSEAAAPDAAATATRKERRLLGEEQFFLVLSIMIGLFAGLAVVCFRISIDWMRWWLLGSGLTPAPGRVWMVPALMGLVIAILVILLFPRVRGSGVNQTKAALYIYDGYIPPGTVIGKFITSALAISSGQSLGPEDPSLQVGAGLASVIGRLLRLSRDKLRLIAPVGAAAGLAAAFNSPITAVLFVIEEVIGRWSAGILGAVVLSAISSVVVERWFLGSEPLFRVPGYTLRNPAELAAYAVLGIVGGAASVVFVKSVAYLRPRLKRLPPWTQYLQPAVAGLLIGLIAIRFPQVMGAGYDYIDQAMHEQYTWELMAGLAGLKILSTVLSFTSGTPGGLFAPTLFIGAMLGGAVGDVERHFFPHLTATIGAYALVGMGTAFAGILRAPMTSVFMILEVSGNYEIVLPVIISNAIAYLISRSLQRTPIFDILSRQDGLDLPSLEEDRELAVMRVEDAMCPAEQAHVLDERALPLAEEVAKWKDDFFLVHRGYAEWGGISRESLLKLLSSTDQRARDGLITPLPHLYPDHALDIALRQIRDWPFLPVVHRASADSLVGTISVADIVEAYRRSARARRNA
jgi:CIC family chloride channel protein